ncbi:MAG: FtsX-like permease family protein, partial [Clostridium sp.]
MKKLLFSKIEIFLIIGFAVSTFAFAMTISTSYSKFNKVTEKNKFNDNYKYIQVDTQKEVKYIDGAEVVDEFNPVRLREIIYELNSIGYEKIILEPSMSNLLIGDITYINKIWPCSPGVDIIEENIIKGRSLTEEELIKGEKVAVINEEIGKLTTQKIDGDYIKIFDDEYRVVGVYGDTEFLKYSTIVPMNSLNFIDGEVVKANFLEYSSGNENIKAYNSQKLNISVSEIEPTPIIGYLKENVYEFKNSMYQILLGVVNLLLFSYFLAKGMKRKVAIMRVLGANNLVIFKEVLKVLLKISSIGLIIGLPLASIAIDYLKETFIYQYSEMNIVIGLITT